jgi:hypothetical protein
MLTSIPRCLVLIGSVAALTGCDRVFKATPEERVGYLRELVRARTVAREPAPIDGCSVNRFMEGVPSWRDSLVPAERATIVTDSTPCTDSIAPRQGRFVLTHWYRNWSGEYVIRGALYPWDQGYRFTDGVYVGREDLELREEQARLAARRAAAPVDSSDSMTLRGDSVRKAGTVADSVAQPPTRLAPDRSP